MKLNIFFKKFSFTENKALIMFDFIENKCITFRSHEINVFSPCVDLNEHD
jgi:hypothetical protein